MSAGRLIDVAVTSRLSNRRFRQRVERMLPILEDDVFERAKKSLDGGNRRLKKGSSRWLKQKTRIIRGKSKSKIAQDYRTSRSVYKAEKRTDSGRLTGFLYESIKPTIADIKFPRPGRAGKVRIRFELDASRASKRSSISRTQSRLLAQVKGLKKRGYKIFPIIKILPETRKKLRSVFG